MEMLSAEFFSSLLAIMMVNLVLSGDNAIVIALAARNLPESVRGKAVIWGTFGAVAVRVVMTLVVVYLLQLPGLRFLGGVALIWIAYKLLADSDGDGHEVEASNSFWGAMKTIVIADAVMGLDNVLAVAGAAKGDMTLIVVGLLLSIPIVVWGSHLIMKAVERFPIIIYIGGGVLAWTAAAMMVHEPMLEPYLEANTWISPVLHLAVLVGVLVGGYLASGAAARANVAAHLRKSAAPAKDESSAVVAAKGENAMVKILVPIDGSANSLLAVRQVVNRFTANSALEVHLLHVRTPLPKYIAQFVKRREREKFHREEAEAIMQPARDLLNQHGVPHAVHIELGERAPTIHKVAQRLHVDQIIMGISRKNSLTRLLEDSVTNSVIEIAQVPVEIVAGGEISKVEKYGLPAGIAAALALLVVLVAAD